MHVFFPRSSESREISRWPPIFGWSMLNIRRVRRVFFLYPFWVMFFSDCHHQTLQVFIKICVDRLKFFRYSTALKQQVVTDGGGNLSEHVWKGRFFSTSSWWFHVFGKNHPYLGKIPILTKIVHDVSKGLKPPTRHIFCRDLSSLTLWSLWAFGRVSVNFLMFVWLFMEALSIGIPGSSKCVKFVPFHQQKPTKRQKFYISRRCRYIYTAYIIYLHYIADASTILASTMPWLLGILLGTLNNPFWIDGNGEQPYFSYSQPFFSCKCFGYQVFTCCFPIPHCWIYATKT